jgi:CBS domain-containing protein
MQNVVESKMEKVGVSSTMEGSAELGRMLREHYAMSLIPPAQELVCVWKEYSVSALLNIFGVNHLLSAPVINEHGQMIAEIDIIDVLRWVLSLERAPREGDFSRLEQEFERCIAGFRMGVDGTVGEVLGFCSSRLVSTPKRAPTTIDSKTSAFDVFKLLSTSNAARVWVLNEQGAPRNVITKKDAFNWLYHRMKALPSCLEFLNTSLRGFGLKECPLRSISIDSTLREAIQTLALHGGAVVLLDNLGTIRANFSPIDVKGLLVEKAPRFTQSCYRFLRTRSHNSIEPLTVDWTSSLKEACEKFDRFGVHHLWVVDVHDNRPVAPFSMTDFLHLVTSAISGSDVYDVESTKIHTVQGSPVIMNAQA